MPVANREQLAVYLISASGAVREESN